MRRAARIDENHAQIVTALRQCGCSVLSLAGVGEGAPDLLVGRNGIDRLLELKIPGEEPSARQKAWHTCWRGHPVQVVTSTLQALAAVGIVRHDFRGHL